MWGGRKREREGETERDLFNIASLTLVFLSLTFALPRTPKGRCASEPQLALLNHISTRDLESTTRRPLFPYSEISPIQTSSGKPPFLPSNCSWFVMPLLSSFGARSVSELKRRTKENKLERSMPHSRMCPFRLKSKESKFCY